MSQMAMAGPQRPPGPIPDVTSVLSRLNQNGSIEGGVQTVQSRRNEPVRP